MSIGSYMNFETMFIFCNCTDAEKKMLLSKLRKASGFGKTVESKTSKRDGSTSTEDLGLFPQNGYYSLCSRYSVTGHQLIFSLHAKATQLSSTFLGLINMNKISKCFYYVNSCIYINKMLE
jgi:hypothetical protein